MKGKHRVVVSTKRLKYDFELRRNLTIIRGDSATGKTTLIDMIQIAMMISWVLMRPNFWAKSDVAPITSTTARVSLIAFFIQFYQLMF